MRTTPLLFPVLLTAAILSTGCSTHKPSHAPFTSNPMAERAAFVDHRAGELIKRGAPKDEAVAHAAGEWEQTVNAQYNRAAEVRRFEQNKLENELAKMARNGDLR